MDREQLLDELARVYARVAIDRLLSEMTIENGAVSDQEQRRRGDQHEQCNTISPAV